MRTSDVCTLSADMKKTPAVASVAIVRTSRARRLKLLRTESSSGRLDPRTPASARSKRRGAEPRRAHLVVRERLSHRDRDAAKHRPRRRQHRHDEPDQGRQQEHPGRHREARDVEVQEHRQVAAERPAAPEARRHRHHEGRAARARAPAPGRVRAIRPSLPPIAFITPIWRTCEATSAVSRFTTRTPLSASAKKPKLAIRSSSRPIRSACGCCPGFGTSTRRTLRRGLRRSAATPVDDAADVRLVHPVAGHEQLELVEVRLLAELGERRERDVAVDDLLHPRLGLPDVGHACRSRAACARRRRACAPSRSCPIRAFTTWSASRSTSISPVAGGQAPCCGVSRLMRTSA